MIIILSCLFLVCHSQGNVNENLKEAKIRRQKFQADEEQYNEGMKILQQRKEDNYVCGKKTGCTESVGYCKKYRRESFCYYKQCHRDFWRRV